MSRTPSGRETSPRGVSAWTAGPRALELGFAQVAPEPFPLLSIVFNGRIIWEGYADREALTVPLKPEVGDNLLILSCLNRTADLSQLRFPMRRPHGLTSLFGSVIIAGKYHFSGKGLRGRAEDERS